MKIVCLCSFDVIFGFAVMVITDLVALLSGILRGYLMQRFGVITILLLDMLILASV